jgi:hypothetical protein
MNTLMGALKKANRELNLNYAEDMLRTMLIPLSDSQVLYVYDLPELRKLYRLVDDEQRFETDEVMKAKLADFLKVVEHVGKEKSKVQARVSK